MKTLILATVTAASTAFALSPAVAQDTSRAIFPTFLTNSQSAAPGVNASGASRAEILANQNAGNYRSDETLHSPEALRQLRRIALEDEN